MAVGEGGVQFALQIDVYRATNLQPASILLSEQCREASAAPPPTVLQPACLTLEGAYAAQWADRVIVASVRREPAAVHQALSLRLLNVIAPRIQALPNTDR
jgi:hypothetical protein